MILLYILLLLLLLLLLYIMYIIRRLGLLDWYAGPMITILIADMSLCLYSVYSVSLSHLYTITILLLLYYDHSIYTIYLSVPQIYKYATFIRRTRYDCVFTILYLYTIYILLLLLLLLECTTTTLCTHSVPLYIYLFFSVTLTLLLLSLRC